MIMLPWQHHGVNCEMSCSPPPSKSSDAHAVNTWTGLTTIKGTAPLLSSDGSTLLTKKLQILKRQGKVPQDFKDATILHLYKRKGNWKLCDNYRGISLLNIAGKIFARILLNRLNGHLEQGLLPESQCGFRRHRGKNDMVFAARQLQEKCQEIRTHLHTIFVDLTKAFDTVNCDGLWKVMQIFDCPERFTHMVRG
ncbi:unnamed protein product [Schistocephalus solidus]|uniref:Reverse transcriptase domain-containing protein n=1 Tax=Schistocephalus solidus TaxID=70667 RepID=A0A183SY37_SCHSO|nr:unnamed protein product [Schistocephalus solidus]